MMRQLRSTWRQLIGSALLSLIASAACSPPPKMQVGRPIEVERELLGHTYRQEGKVIDRRDMERQLRRRPESGKRVQAYRSLNTVGSLMGLTGGVLIGWPIGQAVAGDPNPPWVLAGIGGGVLVATIPLGVVSENQLRKGVEAYNRKLEHAPLGFRPRIAPAPKLELAPVTGGSLLLWSQNF